VFSVDNYSIRGRNCKGFGGDRFRFATRTAPDYRLLSSRIFCFNMLDKSVLP